MNMLTTRNSCLLTATLSFAFLSCKKEEPSKVDGVLPPMPTLIERKVNADSKPAEKNSYTVPTLSEIDPESFGTLIEFVPPRPEITKFIELKDNKFVIPATDAKTLANGIRYIATGLQLTLEASDVTPITSQTTNLPTDFPSEVSSGFLVSAHVKEGRVEENKYIIGSPSSEARPYPERISLPFTKCVLFISPKDVIPCNSEYVVIATKINRP